MAHLPFVYFSILFATNCVYFSDFRSRQVTSLEKQGSRGKVEVEAEEAVEARREKEEKKVERNLGRHRLRKQRKMLTC